MSYILEALRKVEEQRDSLPAQGLSSRQRYQTVTPLISKPKTLIVVSVAVASALLSGGISVYLMGDRIVLPSSTGEQAVTKPAVAVSSLEIKTPMASSHVERGRAEERGEPKQTSLPDSSLLLDKSRSRNSAELAAQAEQKVEAKAAPHLKTNAFPKRKPKDVNRKGAGPHHSVADVQADAKKVGNSIPSIKSNEVPIPSVPGDPLKGLPQVKVDGVLYSSEPGKSVVIIDARLYSEGQATPDGITVEAIRPGGVICSYRGKQFRLTR